MRSTETMASKPGRSEGKRRGPGPHTLLLLCACAVLTILGLQSPRCSSSGETISPFAQGSLKSGLAPPTPRAAAARHTAFDWRAYFRHYPDLLRPPTSLAFTEEAAWRHYSSTGRDQGRIATPLRLRLRYTTAGGLTNQLLGHLPAFIIARELGAEVVVPPCMSRPGFIRGNKEWRWESTETLLDLDKMQAFWVKQGLIVHKTPELTAEQREQYPRLIQRNDPPTALYGNDSCLTIKLPTPGNDLGTIVQRAQQAALAAAEEQLQSSGAPPECINLDTGNSFLRVAVFSAQSLALSTLQGFFFNTTLVSLAEEIKQALGESFNGVHLRLENDAAGWNERFGGEAMVLKAYIHAMQIGFTQASTVYAASGLLFNGTSTEFEQKITALQAAGVAKQVAYKEALVGHERLQDLHSEQLALMDVLVLIGSRAFVGHPQSSMSVTVEQLRICAGFPPQTNQFLDMPLSERDQQRLDRFVRLAADFKPTGIVQK